MNIQSDQVLDLRMKLHLESVVTHRYLTPLAKFSQPLVIRLTERLELSAAGICLDSASILVLHILCPGSLV